MSVDAFASLPHYYDHIKPIWDALEDKGTFYTTPTTKRPGKVTRGLMSGPSVLVAGFPDMKRTRHREHILVEHGAGEDWGRIDPHYPGGPGRDSVILFLCPNQRVAEANSRYDAPCVVVGSPRVEYLQSLVRVPSPRMRLVVSFHWDNRTFDATTSALLHYQPFFGSYASDSRVEVMGHSHPRIAERAEKYFARAGIQFIPDFEDVIRWASVYAVDNSSTLYEAAACGVKVVQLSAPWHPKNDGSWRFDKYKHLPEATPENLVEVAIDANYKDVSYSAMVTDIFGAVDGSAIRAAQAIKEVTNASKSALPSPTTRALPTQPSIFGID